MDSARCIHISVCKLREICTTIIKRGYQCEGCGLWQRLEGGQGRAKGTLNFSCLLFNSFFFFLLSNLPWGSLWRSLPSPAACFLHYLIRRQTLTMLMCDRSCFQGRGEPLDNLLIILTLCKQYLAFSDFIENLNITNNTTPTVLIALYRPNCKNYSEKQHNANIQFMRQS